MSLKTHIKIVVFSCIGMAVFFGVSVVCEFFEFAHHVFLQNMSVNIACSLLVLLFTTLMQYKYEHKAAYREYCSSLFQFISDIKLSFYVETLAGKEYIVTRLREDFDVFRVCDGNLNWFSQKKENAQGRLHTKVAKLYIKYVGLDKNWGEEELDEAIKDISELIELAKTVIQENTYRRMLNGYLKFESASTDSLKDNATEHKRIEVEEENVHE